jgi:hypothetical protein
MFQGLAPGFLLELDAAVAAVGLVLTHLTEPRSILRGLLVAATQHKTAQHYAKHKEKRLLHGFLIHLRPVRHASYPM